MTAIHLQTSIVRSSWRLEALELALEEAIGVARVAVIGSIGLVSVLFDETLTNVDSLIRTMRHAGFEARVLTPPTLEEEESASATPVDAVAAMQALAPLEDPHIAIAN